MASGRSITQNALLLGLARVCNYGFSFLTTVYVARVLRPDSLGVVAFAAAVVSYFSMVAKMGIPLYGMRAVAARRSDSERLAQVTTELFCLGVALSLGTVAILACSVWVIPQLRTSWPLYAALGVGLAVDCLGLDWLYRGLERYRFLLLRDLVVRGIILVLLVLLVRSDKDVYWYVALSALSVVGSAVAGLVLAPRTLRGEGVALEGAFGGWFVRGAKDVRRHVRPSLIFFLMSCATLIYANLDIVMLGFMRPPAEVGYYQLASKARVALIAVSGIVWNAALPRATQMWERGDRIGFETLARRLMGAVCAIQVAVTVVCFVFAEPAVVLFAGKEYLPAVPSLRILLLCLVPVAVSNIFGGQVLVPAGRERLLLASEICGALANLVLNAVLILPMGGVGAAISTVVAEVVVAFGTYTAVRVGLRLKVFPWDRCVGRALRGLERRARRLWYVARYSSAEDMGYCPCCETPIPRWRTGGFMENPEHYDRRRYEHVRQDVLCPICGSLPRHRIIAWHLAGHIELVKGKQLLYFAPEPCMEGWCKRYNVDYTSADLYAPADLTLDIQDTGLDDSSFDVVVCNHVLEHVDDWRRALSELRRVIAPEGLLICSFPIDSRLDTVYEDATVTEPNERVLCFGQYDHQRVFGTDSAELLSDAGFRVEVLHGEELPVRILPVVGPADYDSSDVFLCWRE